MRWWEILELHHGKGECDARFRAVSMRMTNRSMFSPKGLPSDAVLNCSL
jgi:hypothetical protein